MNGTSLALRDFGVRNQNKFQQSLVVEKIVCKFSFWFHSRLFEFMDLISVTALKGIFNLWSFFLILLPLENVTHYFCYQFLSLNEDIIDLVSVVAFKTHIRKRKSDSKCLMTHLIKVDLFLTKNTLPLLVGIAE